MSPSLPDPAAGAPGCAPPESAAAAASSALSVVRSPVAGPVARTRLHQRRIILEGYRRDDGLWDIEGHLTDVKDYDFGHITELKRAGMPIHDMWLRITVDRQLNIVDAQAQMDARPYPGSCEQIAPAYRKLIGLRIAPGFTHAVRHALGGTQGCVHLTEMVGSLATTAFQTLAGERDVVPEDIKPPHLDRCHALDSSGPVVREHYPRWYRADASHAPPPSD